MVTTLFSGLAIGAIYALVAIGYNIIYLAAGTFNFAQAGLVMLGVYLAYWGLEDVGLPAVLVVMIAVTTCAAGSLVIERVAIRPSRDPRVHLVTTIGATTVIAGVVELVWGVDPLAVPAILGNRIFHVGDGVVSQVELTIIALAVVSAAVLTFLSHHTLVGIAALAVSEDREAAIIKGVNASLYSLGGFALAGALAGGVGVVVGPKTFAFTGLAAALALKGFVALALGGYGSIGGSLVGGLIVGVAEAEAEYHWGSEYRSLVVFGILLLVLLTRPSGLFGQRRGRVV